MGRDCRDAFLGLNKTCAKLGIAFWDYLGSRLAVPNQPPIFAGNRQASMRDRMTATTFAPLTSPV
jgi:hypothetical protein